MSQRMSDTIVAILQAEIETPEGYRLTHGHNTQLSDGSIVHCLKVQRCVSPRNRTGEQTVLRLYVGEDRVTVDDVEFLYSDPQVFNAVQLLVMAQCMDDHHTRKLIGLRLWLYVAAAALVWAAILFWSR